MNPTRRQLIAGALATAPVIPPVFAQSAPLIKVATFVPEQSVGVSRVIRPWMNAAQQEVGAKARFQGFWGGSLGKDAFKQFDLVRAGVADVAWILPRYHGRQFEDMQLFELPFLFENAREAALVGWQLCEKKLLRGIEDVHLVGFFATEVSNLWMANPLKSLEELKGKKVRSVGAVHAEWLKAMGASAETMDSPDMNEMLNRNTLDGAIQGATGMKTYKSLALVNQDYNMPMGVIPFLLLVNERRWNALPEDVRAVMLRHGGENTAVSGGKVYEAGGAAINQELKTEGRMKFGQPTDAQMAVHAPKNEAVIRWWADKTPNGPALMAEIQAQLRVLRAAPR